MVSGSIAERWESRRRFTPPHGQDARATQSGGACTAHLSVDSPAARGDTRPPVLRSGLPAAVTPHPSKPLRLRVSAL